MKEYIYTTDFHLKNEVLDIEDANEYLQEENMLNFLKSDFKEIESIFKELYWKLSDKKKGFITLTTSRELTKEESAKISKWINGQCSDGLGEGFEQQDFACYTEKDEIMYDLKKRGIYSIDLGPGEDEPDDSYNTICSFDWESNDYQLRLEMTSIY